MKTCKKCGVDKPVSDFYKLSHTSDGLNYRCIPCQNEYNRATARGKRLAEIAQELIKSFSVIPYVYAIRFMSKIHILDTGCWLWKGSKHRKSGYGRFWISAKIDRLAHRLSYEWSGKTIPENLVIDHLCRNRWCVNPDHMEPVTNVENVMRGNSVWANNSRKTHCNRGHEFTSENTWVSKDGHRHCRECTRLRKRETRARNRLTCDPRVPS